jgi:hypothetical protein
LEATSSVLAIIRFLKEASGMAQHIGLASV